MKKIVSKPVNKNQNQYANRNSNLTIDIEENDDFNSSPISTLFAPLFATPILGYAVLFLTSGYVVNSIKSFTKNNFDSIGLDILGLDNIGLDSFNTDTINSLRTKIDTAIKIAPYLPESIITTMNKYIPMYNNFNRIYSLVEFAQNNASISKIQPSMTLSSQDKINNILEIIKEDYPESALNGVKPVVEIFSNMDKYKTVLNGIKSMSNGTKAPENTISSIIDIAGPLLGLDIANLGKIKEMVEMFQLINVVNSKDEE
ncbi:hypothetical protein PV797_06095 [Clostridiaceae bacterium M8S5]|nr:hypothetical protein PV797_06095 [Clostridiaceae bacterium M8S5]